MNSLAIKRDPFHGEWNHSLLPMRQTDRLIWRASLRQFSLAENREGKYATVLQLDSFLQRLPCMEVRPQRWGNCRYFLTRQRSGMLPRLARIAFAGARHAVRWRAARPLRGANLQGVDLLMIPVEVESTPTCRPGGRGPQSDSKRRRVLAPRRRRRKQGSEGATSLPPARRALSAAGANSQFPVRRRLGVSPGWRLGWNIRRRGRERLEATGGGCATHGRQRRAALAWKVSSVCGWC